MLNLSSSKKNKCFDGVSFFTVAIRMLLITKYFIRMIDERGTRVTII